MRSTGGFLRVDSPTSGAESCRSLADWRRPGDLSPTLDSDCASPHHGDLVADT